MQGVQTPVQMEKKDYTVKKSTCERYDIHFGNGGWAIFTIDEAGGLFNCQSNYGNYTYAWPNHRRKSFKHFILELASDASYFLNKVAKEDYFDEDKALVQWKSKIIELRKDGSCTAEQARDAWDFLVNDVDLSLSVDYLRSEIYDNDAIRAISEEPWYNQDFEINLSYSPQAIFFAEKIMPIFAKILKNEIYASEDIFWQECNGCGKEFRIRYKKDGCYDYLDEPCECGETFSPRDDAPSISQWLEALKAQNQ